MGIMAMIVIACSNPDAKSDNHGDHDAVATANVVSKAELQLNEGAKWIADDATKNNIASLVEIVNDPENSGVKKKEKLLSQLQTGIDSLIYQCRMQGADHDALHIWLEQFMNDMEALKESVPAGYDDAHAALKKDAESFYRFFE